MAASGTGRRFQLVEDDAVAVPVVGNAHRVVSLVAELQAPDAFDLDGRHRELGFGVIALQDLDEGDSVEDESPGQVDRVDAAPFAGAVDAGRAGAERVSHGAKSKGSPNPGGARFASRYRPPRRAREVNVLTSSLALR